MSVNIIITASENAKYRLQLTYSYVLVSNWKTGIVDGPILCLMSRRVTSGYSKQEEKQNGGGRRCLVLRGFAPISRSKYDNKSEEKNKRYVKFNSYVTSVLI